MGKGLGGRRVDTASQLQHAETKESWGEKRCTLPVILSKQHYFKHLLQQSATEQVPSM